jgi:hypothetical protein
MLATADNPLAGRLAMPQVRHAHETPLPLKGCIGGKGLRGTYDAAAVLIK